MKIERINNQVHIPYSEVINNRSLEDYGVIVTGSKNPQADVKNMVSIREQAKEIKQYETLNVVALEKISVEADIKERAGQTEDGKEFSYFYIEVDDQPYRVPVSVLQQLKGLLEEKPETKFFKVNKDGEGMNTKYQVFEA